MDNEDEVDYDDPEYAEQVKELRETLLASASEFLDEEQEKTLRNVFSRALSTI